MADKLLVIMVNADPETPAVLAAPLFQATVAATMDYDAEVILTGRAGELARKGVAEAVAMNGSPGKTVHDVIKEAHEAGVHFRVCTPTLEVWGDDLIPEIEDTVGSAYVISEAMSEGTVTFTY